MAVAVAAGLFVPTVRAYGAHDGAGRALRNSTIIEVAALLASNKAKTKDKEFDPRLDQLRPQLRRFPFKSYTLLRMTSHDLATGDLCGVELPEDRYMQVRVLERSATSMKLRIILNQDNRPIMAADVRLTGNSRVLIGGPRSPDGTLLVSVGQGPAIAAAGAAAR